MHLACVVNHILWYTCKARYMAGQFRLTKHTETLIRNPAPRSCRARIMQDIAHTATRRLFGAAPFLNGGRLLSVVGDL